MTQFQKIQIKYEDSDIIVIEKPAGVVVHPGAGGETDTIVDWLKEKYPKINNLLWPDPNRPGIIHRLDKDTSGLMILGKNPEALLRMQELFQNHLVKKTYLTLVFGKIEKPEGKITGFIGRDPNARRQQTSTNIHFDFQPGKMRESKTYYKVIKEYRFLKNDLSLVEATLDTGRMHQIRVHFKSIGHPVMGDQIYNIKHSKRISKELELNRQFLHSAKLEFENHLFESNLPEDLKEVILKLQ